MSKASRDKGKVAEREIGHILDSYALRHVREQDGRTQGADFIVENYWALEVKRRERLDLLAWHRRLEADTDDRFRPVVVWRPSREPWRVSLRLNDFLPMVDVTKGWL